MPQATQSDLVTHLTALGATDLIGRIPSPTLRGSFNISCDKNPALSLEVRDGKVKLHAGLGDGNFSPPRIVYDAQGHAESVELPNSAMSGCGTYKPVAPIINAVLATGKASCAKGYAVAAMASASGVDRNFRPGLIESYRNLDTQHLPAVHSAVAAVQERWAKLSAQP